MEDKRCLLDARGSLVPPSFYVVIAVAGARTNDFNWEASKPRRW